MLGFVAAACLLGGGLILLSTQQHRTSVRHSSCRMNPPFS
jgi:hypothetical protein